MLPFISHCTANQKFKLSMGTSHTTIWVPETLFLTAVRINIGIYHSGFKVSNRRRIFILDMHYYTCLMLMNSF